MFDLNACHAILRVIPGLTEKPSPTLPPSIYYVIFNGRPCRRPLLYASSAFQRTAGIMKDTSLLGVARVRSDVLSIKVVSVWTRG